LASLGGKGDTTKLTPMDLQELFSQNEQIRVQYRGAILIFSLRNPTHEEDTEYRRRSATIKVASGRAESSALAIGAPTWLFDQICDRVTVENDGQNVENFRDLITADLKLAVIAAWHGRFQVQKTEETR